MRSQEEYDKLYDKIVNVLMDECILDARAEATSTVVLKLCGIKNPSTMATDEDYILSVLNKVIEEYPSVWEMLSTLANDLGERAKTWELITNLLSEEISKISCTTPDSEILQKVIKKKLKTPSAQDFLKSLTSNNA